MFLPSFLSSSRKRYLKLPPRFEVLVRGQAVKPNPLATNLKHPATEIYRPHLSGTEKESEGSGAASSPRSLEPVDCVLGFAAEAPYTRLAGFCVYHHNRLVKPYVLENLASESSQALTLLSLCRCPGPPPPPPPRSPPGCCARVVAGSGTSTSCRTRKWGREFLACCRRSASSPCQGCRTSSAP
jgi:hypothetical protein